MNNCVVIGAGAWGTALAILLARQGLSVVLWGHDPQKMQVLASERTHARYLPGITFPPTLTVATQGLAQAFSACDAVMVIIAVPSTAFESILIELRPFLTEKTCLISATKGLSEEGILFSTVITQALPGVPFAFLSGPSFATEVAKGLPTAVVIGTSFPLLGQKLLQALHSEKFRVYLSDDIIGVQLGGALKNVLAIAVGMSEGLGYGANARSALITRGLAELCRLGEKLGAQVPTLMGLSGVGDLVLTCTDNQSRNRRFGVLLGQGQSCEQAQTQIGQVVEGKMNVKQVMRLAEKLRVELPICQQVYKVLFEGLSPSQSVNNLLSRSPTQEYTLSR